MHSRLVAAALLATLLGAGAARAGEKTSTAQLGKKIDNVTFRDAAGKQFALHDLKDKKAIVVVFLSFECPVSLSYSQPLNDLAAEYAKQGVAVVGLTVNQGETDADVAKHVKDNNLKFPVFRDVDFRAADALKAEVTPEAFVLDGNFVLRYRGRIDNSYYARLKKNQQVTSRDLEQVLGEIVSGRPVGTPATVPIGCAIAREVKEAPKTGTVTYYRDVAPILQNNCQQCHRPGEVGPFSLMNYRQAVNWAADIKEYVRTRKMPPWRIAEGVGFHGERSMSDRDIATLVAWVDGNTPEGNPRDAPPPRTFPQGWQLGTPDLVLTVGDDTQLGPTGDDHFRCFVLPTNLPEDRYVVAVEVRPGNARVVHHTLIYVDTKGRGRKLEESYQAKIKQTPPTGHAALDRGPGYVAGMGVGFVPDGALGGWAPGQMPRYLPESTGMLLPKGADVVMQMHYHRNGRPEKDRTSIGLYFAKKPVARTYQGGVLSGGIWFRIPAGNASYPLKGGAWATDDFTLHSVMPHMHMLGKEIKVTLTPPEGQGQKQTLLAIKQWDYNWQETYVLKAPLAVKSGTRIEVEAVYDNSAGNPNNPNDPPRDVTFGEQTTNEMCFVFLGGTSARTGTRLPVSMFPATKKAKGTE
jgi:peroxiredoxin